MQTLTMTMTIKLVYFSTTIPGIYVCIPVMYKYVKSYMCQVDHKKTDLILFTIFGTAKNKYKIKISVILWKRY